MLKVLFVCTGKSGRSEIASAFAKMIAPGYVKIFSAGDKNHQISLHSISSMKEIGIEIKNKVEYKLEDVKSETFDIVVTLCNKAWEMCPIFPGSPARIHWPLNDPEKTKKKGNEIETYRKIRDDISQRVNALFKFGMLESIREMRLLYRALLDNLTDGVIAHDLNRNIFFINDAALRITGYKRSEVIGRDCHKVFPRKFCGGNCSYCENETSIDSKLRYSTLFTKKSGEQTTLEMSVIPLSASEGKEMGALAVFRDISEVVHLRRRLEQTRGFNGIIGHHISMQRVFNSIRELANVNVPILIQGDTGTGKEMVATALHQLGDRSSGPFVPINCGALPEGTLESELFGHVKGAFTGAISNRKGRFELAEGGTIFLDEIGEISQSMQVKLLRVLQENSFVPVGGEKNIKVNVRVICATNRDLKLLTQQGLFREDLYYRLAVVPINLPNLKERLSDIKLLIEHFLDKYSHDMGKKVRDISSEALDIFTRYNWPGNVRELSNAVQFAMIKCTNGFNIIQKEHLPPEILEYVNEVKPLHPGRPSKINIQEIKEALKKTDGNKAKAAKILNISRTTIYRILEEDVM